MTEFRSLDRCKTRDCDHLSNLHSINNTVVTFVQSYSLNEFMELKDVEMWTESLHGLNFSQTVCLIHTDNNS